MLTRYQPQKTLLFPWKIGKEGSKMKLTDNKNKEKYSLDYRQVTVYFNVTQSVNKRQTS